MTTPTTGPKPPSFSASPKSVATPAPSASSSANTTAQGPVKPSPASAAPGAPQPATGTPAALPPQAATDPAENKTEILKRRLQAAVIDGGTIGFTFILLEIIPYVLLAKVSYLLAQLFLVFICLLFGGVTLFKDGPYSFRFADINLEAQSLGKKFMGLRVLKQDGKTPITWNESAQRNMPLAIPYFLVMITILITAATSFMPLALQIIPFLISILVFFISVGIIGFELFNIWKDPQGRRWGDRLAGTTVFMA